MTGETVISGRWVTLARGRPEEYACLYARRRDEPRTPHEHVAGALRTGPLVPAEGPLGSLLVHDQRTGEAYGVATGFELPQSGILHLTVFLDPRISHPGVGVEAYVLYARASIDAGFRGFHLPVLDDDVIGRRMLERLGLQPQVRLREHAWSGGRLHDSLVYVIDLATFAAVQERLAALLPPRDAAAR